jgi:riboflavin synthase
MFTGIVEEIGTVDAISPGTMTIAAAKVLDDTAIGDSMAVNGACLTVTSCGRHSFKVDVMPETVRCTSLAGLLPGSHVNLERALTLTTRLGGHIVSGHIDGTGQLVSFAAEGNAILMRVAAAPDLLHHIVAKGSVAVDGISLTVAAVTQQDFTVSLIPHTREVTILGDKSTGDIVNIENDILGKYVEKFLQGPLTSKQDAASALTMGFLQENGF